MWKSALMNGIALEGSEDPMVLFTTTIIPTTTTHAFLPYEMARLVMIYKSKPFGAGNDLRFPEVSLR